MFVVTYMFFFVEGAIEFGCLIKLCVFVNISLCLDFLIDGYKMKTRKTKKRKNANLNKINF